MLLFLEVVFKILPITVKSVGVILLVNCSTTELHCNNQCMVVEELACFQYSLNDNISNYREKQNVISKCSGVRPFKVLDIIIDFLHNLWWQSFRHPIAWNWNHSNYYHNQQTSKYGLRDFEAFEAYQFPHTLLQ